MTAPTEKFLSASVVEEEAKARGGTARVREALVPDTLERFGRYEVDLDRKLERALVIPSSIRVMHAAPDGGKGHR